MENRNEANDKLEYNEKGSYSFPNDEYTCWNDFEVWIEKGILDTDEDIMCEINFSA